MDTSLGKQLQSADWKKEKHVPVIEVKETVKPGVPIAVSLSVGEEVPHPHTVEHHIRWIKLFFQPEGEKFTVHLGSFQFEAHGESVKGSGEGSAICEPTVTTSITLKKSGVLMALSYCNIHGLWEGSLPVEIKQD